MRLLLGGDFRFGGLFFYSGLLFGLRGFLFGLLLLGVCGDGRLLLRRLLRLPLRGLLGFLLRLLRLHNHNRGLRLRRCRGRGGFGYPLALNDCRAAEVEGVPEADCRQRRNRRRRAERGEAQPQRRGRGFGRGDQARRLRRNIDSAEFE